jgi:hypothetical protein
VVLLVKAGTSRTMWLLLSAMKRLPKPSTKMDHGWFSSAAVATAPSSAARYPGVFGVPATV